MAYYAALYAAHAVVAYHREGPKTRKGVSNVFHRLAVHESDLPGEVSPVLAARAEIRIKANYDHETMDDWTDADASDAIRRARTFVEEVNAWFGRHHTPDSH